MKLTELKPEELARTIQQDNSLKTKISDNMVTYGGSFVKGLGEALLHADSHNTYKVAITWPMFIKQYLPENWEAKE